MTRKNVEIRPSSFLRSSQLVAWIVADHSRSIARAPSLFRGSAFPLSIKFRPVTEKRGKRNKGKGRHKGRPPSSGVTVSIEVDAPRQSGLARRFSGAQVKALPHLAALGSHTFSLLAQFCEGNLFIPQRRWGTASIQPTLQFSPPILRFD